MRYRITFDREACIGALACAVVNRAFWLEASDGKVDLKDAAFNKETGKWELVIDEKDLKINARSASVCPVEAIVVEPIP
ncbi:ferredoxin [Candidatus Woesearchaeota archaeon]|nr:ferredoxin [Candidatus Woesearchaeota archaeon]